MTLFDIITNKVNKAIKKYCHENIDDYICSLNKRKNEVIQNTFEKVKNYNVTIMQLRHHIEILEKGKFETDAKVLNSLKEKLALLEAKYTGYIEIQKEKVNEYENTIMDLRSRNALADITEKIKNIYHEEPVLELNDELNELKIYLDAKLKTLEDWY